MFLTFCLFQGVHVLDAQLASLGSKMQTLHDKLIAHGVKKVLQSNVNNTANSSSTNNSDCFVCTEHST